ncbi:hypothetical protein AKJ65_05330 [candidate division MSBL1 archaeon SCGC-AAA259E19]|uniref:Uncharacterized protein n=1 Tax=candidate division MSBL1 archaeon SCGC-AAA259E19 TaxID=1698264 RepID=A0A133UJ56_9EURY|nr:hypothetical protein AKJ65_05330 [candidate division MSBL1 archaeon SCGC-AAA259E19]
MIPNEVFLAYPTCPKCGNKNQWVEAEYGPYDEELEKTNILDVYEFDEGKGERVEVPEKWKCAECGHVWVDREAKERVERVKERKRKERACRKIKSTFRERFDMRLKGNRKIWEEIEDVSSVDELKRYFIENFEDGERFLNRLIDLGGGLYAEHFDSLEDVVSFEGG